MQPAYSLHSSGDVGRTETLILPANYDEPNGSTIFEYLSTMPWTIMSAGRMKNHIYTP